MWKCKCGNYNFVDTACCLKCKGVERESKVPDVFKDMFGDIFGGKK